MGTLLQDRGLEGGMPGELWNVENPDAVRAAHEEYAAAGATVLTTNTFGGTRPRLDLHGLGDRVHELNAAAARLAREVADAHGLLVAGDLGPTGELLEPLGTPDRGRRAGALRRAGRGARRRRHRPRAHRDPERPRRGAGRRRAAAQAVAPDVPVVVTLSFDTNLRTMMGVAPAAAVAELGALGVAAVGANCGRGPEEMEQIMAAMAAARPEGVLLVAQSNAGLPHVVGDHFEYDKSPADMAAHAVALRELGVDVIGACCGSTPAHIDAMADALGVRAGA